MKSKTASQSSRASRFGGVSGNAENVVGRSLPHESAELHVRGAAPFLDDLPMPEGTLHAAVGYSPHAHARVVRLDLSAVRRAAGVAVVAAAGDIPGVSDIAPVLPGDPLFAGKTVQCVGQPLFAVAAGSMREARIAAGLARMKFSRLAAVLTLEESLAKQNFIVPEAQFHGMQRGDPDAAIAAAPRRLQGDVRTGGQEHFSLEGHIACALPGENGAMHIISSTQNPSEIQHAAAAVLGCRMRHITVEVRRMGGGFGGKETQAAHPACIAALLARMSNRPVKLRLARRDDFIMTGKRHPFWGRYEAGFDGNGVIAGVKIALAADCGMSPDLSLAILDRAMFHADNAYYFPHARIVGLPCKTNLPSNTAFRGFGGPQGMMAAEAMLTDIARAVGRDPLAVRRDNLYRGRKQLTPYHQQVADNIAPQIVRALARDSDYARRRRAVAAFNRAREEVKKGIALTPVKFGISFTTCFLNQASALVHIYRDGTVHLNHGGTEMGQGLFTKVAQVVAEEFGVSPSRIQCSSARTDKSPNTSATAASAGADLNGKAAQHAAQKLRRRLAAFAAEKYNVRAAGIKFSNDKVQVGGRLLPFAGLVADAYLGRVPLSATGFYKTPKVHYDRNSGRGRPFFYYAYGAAVCEVLADCMTGEYRILRADLLHDVGRSLNPAIDIGQVEGGFVQGLGWLLREEIVRDGGGRLLTDGPATYKIPAAADIPPDFRVALYDGANRENTVFRSKAVGEPPLMLAISAWAALEDAVRACGGGAFSLDAPATPERVFTAVQDARKPADFGGARPSAVENAAVRVMKKWMNKTDFGVHA
ncbi:MAG: xanthine dehydrogenase molybdopterin binding subunit [Gammaproteobacteria bacterium]